MFKAFLRFDAGGKLIAVSAMLLVIIMVKPFLKNDSGNARLYQDACVRAQTVAGMEHNAAEAKLDEIAVEESQKAILESSDPVALQTKLDKEKNIGFILDGNLYTLQKAQEYIDNAKYGTGNDGFLSEIDGWSRVSPYCAESSRWCAAGLFPVHVGPILRNRPVRTGAWCGRGIRRG